MHVVHSPLHARHDGGVELHRGELVPMFESPDRIDHILRAVRASEMPVIEPRDFAIEALHSVHDPAFVEFLRTAYARWQDEGRGGSMLPSGFPARSLRRDRVPEGVNGAVGYYAFDAGTPIVEGTWDASFASARCALTAAIGERMAALRLPTVLVQEGGYAVEAIGAIVGGVLAAFA